MAYNINKSNSDPVTIPTGAIDNQFDIPLIGQDAINYGDDLALAFVRLLENFAADSQPSFGSARTTGQLWYDTTGSGTLNVYDGTQFVAIPKTSEVVQNTGNENIAGDKTFNGTPNFNGGDVSNPPFTVDSSFVVSGLNADQLDGQEGAYYAPASSVVGKETMWIPARQMYSTKQGDSGVTTGADGQAGAGSTTSNLVPLKVALTAGQPLLDAWAFDEATQEEVQFTVAFPDRWDEGTLTYQVFWTANSTNADDVLWDLQALAVDVTENIDAAFTTTTGVTGSNQAAVYRMNRTSESGAFAVDGGPTPGNVVFFRLARDAADVLDTLAVDALLIGIKLYWTSDAATD